MTQRPSAPAGMAIALACSLAGLVGSAAAQPPALVAAAIAGELAEVRRLVEAGAPVDSADRWGGTALAFAAGEGRVEVVRYLLERGADPSRRETFFGQSPLDRALGAGPFTDGLPPERVEIAIELLRHGADDRESALEVALERGELGLARAAVESGPIHASQLAGLRARAATRDPAYQALLRSARSRPDPPPPRYSAAELARFAGAFEGWDQAGDATVEVDGDALRLSGPLPAPVRIEAAGESWFRSTDGGVDVRFYGRAGLIEGFRVQSPRGLLELRRSVADPVPRAATRLAGTDRAVAQHGSDRSGRVSGAEGWPGFRGPGGSGIADRSTGTGAGEPGAASGADGAPAAAPGDSGPPVRFDLASGEGVLWTAALPGLGNSSPIVAGGRVIVTTAVATGTRQEGIRTGLTGVGTEVDEAAEHRWLVLAFDARTGAKSWETEVGRGVPASKRHIKATQANSTPASDGKSIAVVFPTAGLAVLDLDGGRVRWKRDLGPLRAGAFNDPTLEWGFASSPVLWDGRLILQVDTHEAPYLAAWELGTGRELWRTARDGVAPSWATPALWATPDGVEVVANASIIRGYDARDGRELWSLRPTSEQVVATPVVADGILYVSAGYPPVKPIYAVKPGIRGAVEAVPGEPDPRFVWSDARGGAYMPTPLVYRGLLYVVHHNARLVAYDAVTGAALYKARFSHGGTFTSSPVAVAGRIYTGTEEGSLYVFAAGPEFEELAVNDLGEPVMATPAIADGVLYVRTPSRLVAIGR